MASAQLLLSCAGRESVLHPSFGDQSMLEGSAPLAKGALEKLAGLYSPKTGSHFGNQDVVLHATRETLSIFAADGTYAILRGGCLDAGTRVVFEGYWRTPTSSATGLVRLFLGPEAAASVACSAQSPENLPAWSFSGATGTGASLPAEPVELAVDDSKPFKPTNKSGSFIVAAHHGACRTVDDCGASENSLESIRMVEAFGASVVEVDVRLTADGVPILFHDDNFGPRLTRGAYCHGPVADFTLQDIRALCSLTYGEQIPTLEEALDTALNETRLRGVWLDTKVTEAVAPVLELMKEQPRKARDKQRDFGVVIGLAEQELLDAYRAYPNKDASSTCLVELDPSDVRDTPCKVWGPRWTRGPMAADVASLMRDGKAVVYWTIDEPEYVDLFLAAHPTGILTDRPGLVNQRFETMGAEPDPKGGI